MHYIFNLVKFETNLYNRLQSFATHKNETNSWFRFPYIFLRYQVLVVYVRGFNRKPRGPENSIRLGSPLPFMVPKRSTCQGNINNSRTYALYLNSWLQILLTRKLKPRSSAMLSFA